MCHEGMEQSLFTGWGEKNRQALSLHFMAGQGGAKIWISIAGVFASN